MALTTTSQETLDLLEKQPGPRRRVLLRNMTVISMDPAVGDLARGDILIEGTKITAVGPDLSEAGADGQAVSVDLSGHIAIPGLHDTHRHCWQTQLRRLIPDADLEGYMVTTHFGLGPFYRPEDMYAGNLITAYGAMDSGITCVMDFSHNARSAAHSDACINAWKDSGIRAVHASCGPVAGEWEGNWPGDLRRMRDEHFASDDQLVTLRLGILAKAVPAVTDPVAWTPEVQAQARELGLRTSVDAVFGQGASVQLEEFGSKGILGDDVTLIHCQGLSDDAWRYIADTGCHVSLAPTSDANLGQMGGITPVQQALDHGLRPSLGGDVECCLATDLFSQMQTVLSIQRMMAASRAHAGDESAPEPISSRTVLEFATVNGAKANGLWDKVGSLSPGKDADLVLIDANDVRTMPLNNALGTVVIGTDSKSIRGVFVAGSPVKWDGQVVGVDLARLRQLVTESRDYLVEAGGYDLDVAR